MRLNNGFAVMAGALVIAFLANPVNAYADRLYFVDAHSQVDHKVNDIGIVLERMREHGVEVTILAPRGRREDEDIAKLAKASGGKIIASIRTKGGKYKKNKPQYYEKLRKQSSSGKYGAIAEVLMYHAQKGEQAEEVDIGPGDKRVKAALSVARKNRWPFVAHIEFAALQGDKRKQFKKDFESMLASNRPTPILLIHMGQLRPNEARELLKAHENLYLLTSHADPFTTETSSQPWVNMFNGRKLKSEWKLLLQQYPDRFVFALDNVWAEHWQTSYGQKVALWREALQELDRVTAAKVAHGNAERLFSLKK